MLRLRARPKQASPDDAKSADIRVSAWSEYDKRCLQRAIDPLKTSFGVQLFGFLRADATTMLCAPSSEIYERLTSMLSNVCVVSGLVLSSIAGVALSPLAVDDFPTPKQALAEAYNVVAAVAVATQICVVLYSTFTLYLVISTAHNPTASYRALVHMSRWIGFFEFMTFIPAMLSIVLVCLAAHLYCRWAACKWVVTGCCCALVVLFQGLFGYVCACAVPYNAWAWASLAGPHWLFFSRVRARLRASAKAHGELLLAQAKEGVLGGLDENDDYVIDQQPSEQEVAEEAEMTSWVKGTLHLGETNCILLVKELLANGLTRERMVEAAGHPGGFQVLCDMLAAQMGELGLRPGDRLALAAAAMKEHKLAFCENVKI
jgi:hypothetical protein